MLDSAVRSSLRELIPSFPNTLRRCHSTVRELRNSWAPISGFVCPSGGQARNLHLLRRQLVERLDRALSHRLAGRQQLAPSALGERVGADVREHRVSDSQLRAGVDATVLTPQPLAVEEMGAGELYPQACALKLFDRFLIKSLRRIAGAHQRSRPGLDPACPRRGARLGLLAERVESASRHVLLVAPNPGLDQLR